MDEQTSLFDPQEYQNAWSKEEMKPQIDEVRAGARQKHLDRLRAHNESVFHDRRND
jgi:hypothetical protein